MSLAMDLQLEVRKMPGNKVCADCPARNPQWASVSHGTLICLECSGKHRSLGVHISFVRSLQMDSWNEKQIKSLKYGGNKKLNKFLKAHGVPVEKLSIKEKYDNPTAEAFRERISARISGDKDYSSIEIPMYNATQSRAPIKKKKEKDFASAPPNDRKRMEEEARERMRKKFGKSTGLGSNGAFSNQAVGSHGLHHESSSQRSNYKKDWFSSMGTAVTQLGSRAAATAQAAVNSQSSSGWSDWASNLASKASERARAAAGVVKSATSTQESTPTLYRREGVSDFPKLYNRDLNNTKHGQMGKVMTGIGGGGDGISNSEGIDSKNMKKYSKNGVKKPNHNSVKSAWLDSSNDTWGDDFGWDDMEDINTNKKDKIQSTNSSTKSIKTKKIKKKGKKRPSNLTSSSSSTGHGHMVKSPRCARNTKSFMEDDFFSDVHLASSLSESMNDLNTTQTTRNMYEKKKQSNLSESMNDLNTTQTTRNIHEKKKQIMDTEDDFFNSDW